MTTTVDNCSIPIWPTQLRRYAGIALPAEPLRRDYNVNALQNDPSRPYVRGDWKAIVHPSGAVYHYNASKNTYTGMNLRACSSDQLERLEAWIEESRAKLNGNKWVLVVDQVLARGKEVYPYYYVDMESHIIGWTDHMKGDLLFRECTAAWEWNHKRLELEAQYWKHVEYFPRGIEMHLSELIDVRGELNWYRVDAVSLQQSTAGSIFWTPDQMKQLIDELTVAEQLAAREGAVRETTVAICGRIMHMLRHHEYLNHHGQPQARLMRTHSLGERHGNLEKSRLMAVVSAAMLWVPTVMLKRLRDIYVDGLVNGVDMKGFVDDLSAQSKAQTTIATVVMAVDAAILAIPGLGSSLYAKILCSISFAFSAGCIVACTIALHLGYRMRSLDFTVYHLQWKMARFVMAASIPSVLYLTSLAFSILGFLAGVFTDEFEFPLFAKIGFVLAVMVVVCLVIPLAIVGFGPDLIQHDESSLA